MTRGEICAQIDKLRLDPDLRNPLSCRHSFVVYQLGKLYELIGASAQSSPIQNASARSKIQIQKEIDALKRSEDFKSRTSPRRRIILRELENLFNELYSS